MLPVYLLTISRESLFRASDHVEFSNDAFFEKTVMPTIKEHKHIVFPGNKMYWKYYELSKFKQLQKKVTGKDPIKIQWLDFLSRCSTRKEVPQEVDQLVQQAYGIMERAKWNKEQIEEFELAMTNESLEEDYRERLLRESEAKGKAEEKSEIAIKMLQAQVSKLDIAKYTGLSSEQIMSLEQHTMEAKESATNNTIVSKPKPQL
jgi:hypothetical protein